LKYAYTVKFLGIIKRAFYGYCFLEKNLHIKKPQ